MERKSKESVNILINRLFHLPIDGAAVNERGKFPKSSPEIISDAAEN